MEHQGFYSDAVQTASGYDYQRSTSYQIEAVPDEWHGVPVPVLVLRVTEGKETFWVITSDVELSVVYAPGIPASYSLLKGKISLHYSVKTPSKKLLGKFWKLVQ